VLQNLFATLQSCDTFILPVVDPSQSKPFASTFDKGLPQFRFGRVILDRIRIQRRNLDSTLEVADIDDSLYPADTDSIGHRSVDQIDALASELVDGDTIECGPGDAIELERTQFTRNGALRNENGAGK
jgi:hypothetical protein